MADWILIEYKDIKLLVADNYDHEMLVQSLPMVESLKSLQDKLKADHRVNDIIAYNPEGQRLLEQIDQLKHDLNEFKESCCVMGYPFDVYDAEVIARTTAYKFERQSASR